MESMKLHGATLTATSVSPGKLLSIAAVFFAQRRLRRLLEDGAVIEIERGRLVAGGRPQADTTLSSMEYLILFEGKGGSGGRFAIVS